MLIIYGASGGGQKIAKTLNSFNIEIHCFVDINSALWDKKVLNKAVYAPEYIVDKECNIIIASDAGYSEIKKTLMLLGKSDSCILKEELILPKVHSIASELQLHKTVKEQSVEREKANENDNIFLELMDGYQLGGIENWSFLVAKGLERKDVKVQILCPRIKGTPPEWEGLIYDKFNGDYSDYKNSIVDIFRYLEKNLPCTLILNRHQHVMYAGYLLKQLYPKQVKIFSVIHNDLESLYDRHTYMDSIVDGYMCVSKKIKNHLKSEYSIPESRLFNKESPVVFDINNPNISIQRSYPINEREPIRIAYGARLEKMQKRADLIIPFIEELEKRDCNYHLDIAGEGTYLPILNEFINKYSLFSKIKLHGRIEHKDMKQFWSSADIFISLSEMEGLSISMLEAMACGAVPVMFEVAGADEFIVDDQNGFIIPYCDYGMMADKITYLFENREIMADMGRKSASIINEKCDYNAYIEYLLKVLF